MILSNGSIAIGSAFQTFWDSIVFATLIGSLEKPVTISFQLFSAIDGFITMVFHITWENTVNLSIISVRICITAIHQRNFAQAGDDRE